MTELRRTKQRQAMHAVLDDLDGFASAQQIHETLNLRGESVGLSTVYRNLQALVESEEVDAIRTDDGEVMYRLCKTNAHHHHLVCERCGATVEIDGHEVERWTEDITAAHGFSAISHRLEIFGTCSECVRLES